MLPSSLRSDSSSFLIVLFCWAVYCEVSHFATCTTHLNYASVSSGSDVLGWGLYGASFPAIQNPWTISFEMSGFTTIVAKLIHSSTNNRGVWLCRCPVVSYGVSLHVAVLTLKFTALSYMVKVAFLGTWKFSSILLHWRWH